MQSNDEVGLMTFFANNHAKIKNSSIESDLTLLKEIPKQASLKC